MRTPPANPSPHPASETDDRHYWLALQRAPGIGNRRCQKLLCEFDSPADVFEADAERLRALGLRPESIDYLSNPDWAAVEQDLDWLAKPGNRQKVILASKVAGPGRMDHVRPNMALDRKNIQQAIESSLNRLQTCLLYTSPSPRDLN